MLKVWYQMYLRFSLKPRASEFTEASLDNAAFDRSFFQEWAPHYPHSPVAAGGRMYSLAPIFGEMAGPPRSSFCPRWPPLTE